MTLQDHQDGGGAAQATARVSLTSSAALASFFCSKGFWNVAFGPSWEDHSVTLFPSRSSFREKAETSWRSWNTHLETNQTNENHIRHHILGRILHLREKGFHRIRFLHKNEPGLVSGSQCMLFSVLTSQWDTGC